MKSTKQSGRDTGQTTSDWSTRTGARTRSPHRRAVWLYFLHREAVSFNGRLCRGDGNQGRGNRGRKAVHVAFALDYIEGWYNPRRRHSALDYLSPIAYERRALSLL